MTQTITIVPRLTNVPFEFDIPDDLDAQVVGNLMVQAFEAGAEHASETIMSSLLSRDDPYNRSAD